MNILHEINQNINIRSRRASAWKMLKTSKFISKDEEVCCDLGWSVPCIMEYERLLTHAPSTWTVCSYKQKINPLKEAQLSCRLPWSWGFIYFHLCWCFSLRLRSTWASDSLSIEVCNWYLQSDRWRGCMPLKTPSKEETLELPALPIIGTWCYLVRISRVRPRSNWVLIDLEHARCQFCDGKDNRKLINWLQLVLSQNPHFIMKRNGSRFCLPLKTSLTSPGEGSTDCHIKSFQMISQQVSPWIKATSFTVTAFVGIIGHKMENN